MLQSLTYKSISSIFTVHYFIARVDTTSYSAGVYGVSYESRLWITHEFVVLPDHVDVGGQIVATDHGSIPTIEDENL